MERTLEEEYKEKGRGGRKEEGVGQPVKKFEQKEGRNANSNLLRSFFRLLTSLLEERPFII